MGFMKPVAEYMVVYHVETNAGTELVPEDVCGALDEAGGLTPFESVENLAKLANYLEDPEHVAGVERHEGWYGRLSADGYLDCTSWDGPHESEFAALDAVKELYDVDDEGDLLEEGS